MPDPDARYIDGVPAQVVPAPSGHWFDGERLIEGEWVKETYPVVAYGWLPDGDSEAYVVTAEPEPVPLPEVLGGRNFRSLGYRVDPTATHRLYDEDE